MKYWIIVLFFVLLAGRGIKSQTNNNLVNEMQTFFSEILMREYHNENESLNYQNFLDDYFKSFVSMGNAYDKSKVYSVIVDKDELKRINRQLFIRDLDHYYYFFSEVILVKTDSALEKAKLLFDLYPDFPICIEKLGGLISEKGSKCLSIYEAPSVVMSDEFLMDYRDIIESIGGSIIWDRQMHFNNFAKYFRHKESETILSNKKVRELVAVVFWKYLCDQAGLDFYAIPDEYDYMFEDYR